MINNCSSYITGVGADSQNASASLDTCTTNTYETAKGQAASTTGNITGVYDMSGGAYDRVMGVYNETVGNSEINFTLLDIKYYDNYVTTDMTTACNSGVCYGHALSETTGWYGDLVSFGNSSNSWFKRGGNYNITAGAGVFYFNVDSGYADRYGSFRVVITRD